MLNKNYLVIVWGVLFVMRTVSNNLNLTGKELRPPLLFNLVLCACVFCLRICLCTICVPDSQRDPLELELQVL